MKFDGFDIFMWVILSVCAFCLVMAVIAGTKGPKAPDVTVIKGVTAPDGCTYMLFSTPSGTPIGVVHSGNCTNHTNL